MSNHVVTRILSAAGVDTITIALFTSQEIDLEVLLMMDPTHYEELEAQQYYGAITQILETEDLSNYELQD